MNDSFNMQYSVWDCATILRFILENKDLMDFKTLSALCDKVKLYAEEADKKFTESHGEDQDGQV